MSLLTNPKMSPELRARVSSSVRGLRRGHGARLYAPTRTALLRLSVVGFVIVVVALVWRERQSRALELAQAKERLLQEREQARATLTPNAYTLAERVQLVLRRESNDYAGAVRDDNLTTPNDWQALFRRRLLYARLPTGSVNSPEKLESHLSESKPDAFVLCLKQPAEGRDENALMKRINAINGDAMATKEQLLDVHPAFDAIVTLQLLERSIDESVERAAELKAVLDMQDMWDKARVDERLPSVSAEVLIALLDEPKVADTPVELDGASVHKARVMIVDLSRDKDKVLFRGRYDMNPSWVSERRRHQYANSLDSCRVATEIRNPALVKTVANEPNKPSK